MAKLRPINETRRPDGTLTSETARRLLCSRGGRSRAEQMKADGYSNILSQSSINKAKLTKALKAASTRQCKACQTLAARVYALLATEHPQVYAALTAEDKAKLG